MTTAYRGPVLIDAATGVGATSMLPAAAAGVADFESDYLAEGYALTGLNSVTGRHFYTGFDKRIATANAEALDFQDSTGATAGTTSALSAVETGGVLIVDSTATAHRGACRGPGAQVCLSTVPGRAGSNHWYLCAKMKCSLTSDGQQQSQLQLWDGTRVIVIGAISSVNATNFCAYVGWTGGSSTGALQIGGVDVPVETANYHVFRLWNTADNNIYAKMDSGNTLSLAMTATTGWGVNAVVGVESINNATAASVKTYVDDFLFLWPQA